MYLNLRIDLEQPNSEKPFRPMPYFLLSVDC